MHHVHLDLLFWFLSLVAAFSGTTSSLYLPCFLLLLLLALMLSSSSLASGSYKALRFALYCRQRAQSENHFCVSGQSCFVDA